jgi:lipoyl(octanoyl) transferase
MKNKGSGLRTEDSKLPTSYSVLSPDGTTSHSTRLGSNTSQVAGYHHSLPVIHSLGLVEYQPTWEAMKKFTAERTSDTRDEIWLVQHPSVYTQGLAGKPEHLLRNTNIPVVKIDRGGQITYHGPGQIVAYLLLDMRRWKIKVRELVRLMEHAVIDLLAEHGVAAQSREDAPGVYVGGAKIAALGLKIKNGCCYHGLSFNVGMDLGPFANINPCGYAGLRVTQACELGITVSINELKPSWRRI